ncbi:MAG TPA: hypothetical protein VEJ67_15055 [Candidatus Cybelea sp.]|nr:hypothetical protein [Candidatus Cybelea sp.]
MENTNRNAKVLLLVFSICAFADFGWSYMKGRSLAECVISAVLGLIGTAWYAFCFGMFGNGKPKPRRGHEGLHDRAHWVP